MINPHFKMLIKELDLIVYDFDGVMTDNCVLIDQNGKESVSVNRSDGLAVNLIKVLGVKQIILSTEINPVVSMRARKIGLDVIQGANDKKRVLEDYCKMSGISPERVLYIGNDINDLEVMNFVGHKMCPLDAHEKIKGISDRILSKKGGDGVIRELADILGVQ